MFSGADMENVSDVILQSTSEKTPARVADRNSVPLEIGLNKMGLGIMKKNEVAAKRRSTWSHVFDQVNFDVSNACIVRMRNKCNAEK
jgi:hypothetical protein